MKKLPKKDNDINQNVGPTKNGEAYQPRQESIRNSCTRGKDLAMASTSLHSIALGRYKYMCSLADWKKEYGHCLQVKC